MGLFVRIDFACSCPRCGKKVIDFQSKEFNDLTLMKPWEVNRFYSQCFYCRFWVVVVRFDQEEPLPERVPPPEPINWKSKYGIKGGDDLRDVKFICNVKVQDHERKTIDTSEAKS